MTTNLVSIRSLYPSLDEFMKLLQEEGVPEKKGSKMLFHKKTHAFSTRLFKKLVALKIPGVGKNTTREILKITSIIVLSKNHYDCSMVYEELRGYRKPASSTKVYIVQNNVDDAGFSVILEKIALSLNHNSAVADTVREPNDALRVCGILLDPQYKDTVAGIMANTKDRAKCDQPMDTTLAFCQDAVLDFNNPHYIVNDPSKSFELDDYEEMDANDITRIEKLRDANWFWYTWRKYFLPKYRKYLHKYDLDTGGGPGGKAHFQEYCENSKWVAWVYLLDEDMGFLLSGNASPTVPDHLKNEPGSNNSKSSKHLLHKRAMEHSENLNDVMAITKDVLSKMDVFVTNKASVQVDTPLTAAYKKYEELGKRQKVIQDDDDFSPNSKEVLMASIKDQKKIQANIFACKLAEKDKCDTAKDKCNVGDDKDSLLEEPSWMKSKKG